MVLTLFWVGFNTFLARLWLNYKDYENYKKTSKNGKLRHGRSYLSRTYPCMVGNDSFPSIYYYGSPRAQVPKRQWVPKGPPWDPMDPPMGSHGSPPWDPMGPQPKIHPKTRFYKYFISKYIPKCDFIGILYQNTSQNAIL